MKFPYGCSIPSEPVDPRPHLAAPSLEREAAVAERASLLEGARNHAARVSVETETNAVAKVDLLQAAGFFLLLGVNQHDLISGDEAARRCPLPEGFSMHLLFLVPFSD